MNQRWKARQREMISRTTIVVCLVGMSLGCGAGQQRAPSPVLVSEPLPMPAIVLETIEVRDVAEGTLLEVGANAPLVWTSYRNAGGDFILELADTVPSPNLATTLTPVGGEIARVSVVLDDMLRRSPLGDPLPPKRMTRITVLTRRDAVHALRSTNQRLSLTFTPVDATAPLNPNPDRARNRAPQPFDVPEPPTPIADPAAIESESLADDFASNGRDSAPEAIAVAPPPPVAAPAPRTPPVSPTPAPPVPVPRTTPPQPSTSATATAGDPGTQLRGASIRDGRFGTVLHLRSDGPLTAKPFRLREPARFVIDLPGVLLESDQRELMVGTGGVARLRLGQFQRQPPIARVVLDLDNPTAEPGLEPVADGLLLHLSSDR